MARRSTRDGRTVVRRRDGVVAIRRTERWRRVLPVVADALLALVPLVLVLRFVLPPALVPIPPLALALAAWVLFRRPRGPERALEPATRSRVVALRSARRRRLRE